MMNWADSERERIMAVIHCMGVMGKSEKKSGEQGAGAVIEVVLRRVEKMSVAPDWTKGEAVMVSNGSGNWKRRYNKVSKQREAQKICHIQKKRRKLTSYCRPSISVQIRINLIKEIEWSRITFLNCENES